MTEQKGQTLDAWATVQPGGPAGPFWGVWQPNPGYVIVLQAASQKVAEQIVADHAAARRLAQAVRTLERIAGPEGEWAAWCQDIARRTLAEIEGDG